ncbi:MAG: hypothetical protein IKL60_06485 [Alistipes sp.]|nr:hypothetical protein [Alistipes sp.]
MRRIVTFLSIFIAISLTASAQMNSYNVEPVRSRIVPYAKMSDAKSGEVALSRYALTLSEWSESKRGENNCYTAYFPMNVDWLNRQVILRIGFADKALRVFVNGREVGYSACGAYGVEFNITKRVNEGRNEVQLLVDSSAASNRLYTPRSQEKGASVGTFGDVMVLCPPTIRIRDILCETSLNSAGDGVVEVAIPVKCDALNRKSATMNYTLRLNDSIVVTQGSREISLAMRAEDTLRFATTLPKERLWSAKSPMRLRLDVESRIDNRIVECVSCDVALRSLEVKRDKLYINGEPVSLRLVEWEAVENLDEVVKLGYNGIIINSGYGLEKSLWECEKAGLYVVVRAPIDTSALGADIRKGGNPTNDPAWRDAFVERTMGVVDATKGSGAVVGYMLGKGKTCGVNIYDAYLLVKGRVPNHIVLYEGANGEWCSDRVAVR